MVTYVKAITKGSKGEHVRNLQKALTELGYFVNGIDGNCGNGCYSAILQFQKDNKLTVDGWAGIATHNKINELLSKTSNQLLTNKPKYYKYGTAHVIEVNPLDLYIDVVKVAGNKIKGDFVNGGFFGYPQGKFTAASTLMSNGKVVFEQHPLENVRRGTFVIYKDGTCAIEMIDFITKHKRLNDIKFAIGGYNIMPKGMTLRQSVKNERYDINGIGYKTWRTIIAYKNGKVLLIVIPNATSEENQKLLEKMGCEFAVGLDGGGSTCGRINGQTIRAVSRVIHNIIRW